MNETHKLLPCPFCGRRPSLRKGRQYKRAGMVGEWMMRPGVSCNPCRISRDFDSVEDAVAWWNKRAPVRHIFEPPAGESVKTNKNRMWLREHAAEYPRQWLALRDGELLDSDESLQLLTERVSENFGVTFPSREVMVTSGEPTY